MREIFTLRVPGLGDIPTTRPSCVLCGGRDASPVNTFVLNGQRFHTVRCERDGMMWLDPRPTEAFYERLYREHYHRVVGLQERGADGLEHTEDDPLLEQATLDVHTDDAALWRVAGWRLDELQALGARPPGRLLEVGFGGGHTLAEAQRRGWEVVGLEASEACVAAAVAKGISPARVKCAPFLTHEAHDPHPMERVEPVEREAPEGADVERVPRGFDVVAAYSVIEHVPEPATWLRRAHALLRPGGLLVLRLPDTPDEGPCASLIAHVHHFNQQTIAELLRRCGFDVCSFGSFSVWRPTRYPGELPNMNVAARRPTATATATTGSAPAAPAS